MDILLTGSVAYDYLMTFPGHFKEQILPERREIADVLRKLSPAGRRKFLLAHEPGALCSR